MYNTYFDRLFLNITIWLIAVVVNAFLLSLYMSDFGRHLVALGDFFGAGIIIGGIFSFPVMIALHFTLRSCIRSKMTGVCLFDTMLVVGTVLAAIMALFVCALAELKGLQLVAFISIPVLSGIASISFQYRTLLKYGSDFTTASKV